MQTRNISVLGREQQVQEQEGPGWGPGWEGAQEAERTGREASLQGRTARARGLQQELVVFPTPSGKPLERGLTKK